MEAWVTGSGRGSGEGPRRAAPPASFIMYAMASPRAIFRFHLAHSCII